MLYRKVLLKKLLQKNLYLQIAVVILIVCFLFITFYTASALSTLKFSNFIEEKVTETVYVREDFVHVVITTDKSDIIGAIALVNSIVKNTEKPIFFYFVTNRESVQELHTRIEDVKFSRMFYVIKSFDPNDFGINSTHIELNEQNMLEFSKFFIPKLFPQISDILICLSSDVIVQSDIEILQNTTIKNNHFGALSTDCDILTKIVRNNKNKYFNYLNMNSSHIKQTHVKENQCTFDLSVMVLNMTLWEEEDVTKQLTTWYHLNEKEKVFLRHDVLSPFLLVFNNRITILDTLWHVRHLGAMRGTRYSKKYLEDAHLLQWNGHFKPWAHHSAISYLWSRYALGGQQNVKDH